MANDGKRLFFGVRVSVATANSLARCTEALARRARDAKLDIRWVAPTSYHVTLKFLGWTRTDAIAAVHDRVATAIAGMAPFSYRTARIGAFASLDKATIVWAGVDDASGMLAELARRIDATTAALGFAAETRAFHPHVTLGRLRETRALRDVVLPMSEQMFSDTKVDAISLMESETKSSGSVYREVAEIGFKPAEIAPETAVQRQTGALQLGDETDPATDETETDDGWPLGARHQLKEI